MDEHTVENDVRCGRCGRTWRGQHAQWCRDRADTAENDEADRREMDRLRELGEVLARRRGCTEENKCWEFCVEMAIEHLAKGAKA